MSIHTPLKIFSQKCSTLKKVFITLLTISLLILTFKILYCNPVSVLLILKYIFLICLFSSLVFLAYFDFKKMEVHATISLILIVVLLLLNLGIYISSGSDGFVFIGENWRYSPYQNFISTIILGSIFLLIFLLSKEKGLGEGDIRIAIIIGLIIGFQNVLLWSYITVFSALIYGLILAFKKRKLKGLKIPFVPFMTLGCIVVILLSI